MIVQTDKYSFKLKFKQIGTVLNESFSGLAPFNFAQSICASRRVFGGKTEDIFFHIWTIFLLLVYEENTL